MTRHLYIHVPFCRSICSFCDFKRDLIEKYDVKQYLTNLLLQLQQYTPQQFTTIYIGGGTPNCLLSEDLKTLLTPLTKLLAQDGEFTIECNPEFVTGKQVGIFKQFGINRISLGVQTTNEKILKAVGRRHTNKDVLRSLRVIKQHQIENVSLDFIYSLPGLTNDDIAQAVKFGHDHHVKHISFYGLELKPNSRLTKSGYQIDQFADEEQMLFVQKMMQHYRFKRYEISNWAVSKKYQSKHNLCYWLTKDWAGIGSGSYGLEDQVSYYWDGDLVNPVKKPIKLSQHEYYQQVLMMGLRLVDGIDLSLHPYNDAYHYFKDKLNYVYIKNNRLYCQNIDLLHESLIDLFD